MYSSLIDSENKEKLSMTDMEGLWTLVDFMAMSKEDTHVVEGKADDIALTGPEALPQGENSNQHFGTTDALFAEQFSPTTFSSEMPMPSIQGWSF